MKDSSRFLHSAGVSFKNIYQEEGDAAVCESDNTTTPHISASLWKYVSSVYYVSTAETNFHVVAKFAWNLRWCPSEATGKPSPKEDDISSSSRLDVACVGITGLLSQDVARQWSRWKGAIPRRRLRNGSWCSRASNAATRRKERKTAKWREKKGAINPPCSAVPSLPLWWQPGRIITNSGVTNGWDWGENGEGGLQKN